MKRLLVLVLVSTLALCFLFIWKNEIEASEADPVTLALRGHRPLIPRLVGDFDYRPKDTDQRETWFPEDRPYTRMILFLRTGSLNPSATVLRQQALVELYTNPDREAIRLSIALLERAHDVSPKDGSVLNDLAAIHIHLARVTREFSHLPMAYSLLERALEASPDLVEALFNWALVNASLGLTDEAIHAWNQYIALEDDQQWIAEARLRSMESTGDRARTTHQGTTLPLQLSPDADAHKVLTHLGELHDLVMNDYLPCWVENELGLVALEPLTYIAATRDPFLDDAIRAILGARGKELRSVRNAMRRFFQARAHSDSSAMKEVVSGFEAIEHPFRLLARYELALIEFDADQDHEVMVARMQELREAAAVRGYLDLEARTHWMEAHAAFIQRDLEQTRTGYRRATDIYDTLKNREKRLGSWIQQGFFNAWVGDLGTAWRWIGNVLEELDQVNDPLRNVQGFALAAYTAHRAGYPQLAFRYQSKHLKRAMAYEKPRDIASSHAWLAFICHQLGRGDEVKQHIESGKRWADRIAGAKARATVLGNLMVVEAESIVATRDRIARLEESLASLRSLENALYEGWLLSMLAEEHLGKGNLETAAEYMIGAIDLYERDRHQLEQSTRQEMFDSVSKIFTEAVAVQIRLGQYQEAFYTQERSRARMLLDALSIKELAQPKRWHSIARDLEADEVVLVYAQIDERIVRWSLGRDDLSMEVLTITPRELEGLIDSLRIHIELEDGSSNMISIAEKLYEALLPREVLNRVTSLIIVPDGPLHRLPFGVLHDGSRGHLLESHTLSTVPSAAVFHACRVIAEKKTRSGFHSLSVGANRFDEEGYPELEPLPGALDEAKGVYEIHGGTIIGEDKATITRVLAALKRSTTAHIAAHVTTSFSKTEQTILHLAPEEGVSDGNLTLAGFADLSFPELRMITLSGCRTADGMRQPAEGLVSMARSFLAAGVPTVVASHWSVEDGPTVALMVAFHRALRDGLPVGEALQSASVSALRAGRSPRVWAAFQVIGEGKTSLAK